MDILNLIRYRMLQLFIKFKLFLHEVFIAAVLGLAGLPILIFIEKYVFNDWQFLIYLMTLIVLDTGLGFGLAVKARKLNPDKFGGLISKLINYAVALIVGHIFANFTVDGEVVPVAHYFKLLIYSAVIVKESISILKHAARINKKYVPAWLLQRLEEFDTTGNLEALKGDNKTS